MNKKGSTLIMTIFLVMLLSVLALALFTVAVSDKQQVIQQDDQMQSYYVARAGADAVAEFIILNPLEVFKMNGVESDEFSIGAGTVKVTPTVISTHSDGTASKIELLSVGTVEDRSKSVTLTLGHLAMDHAIFTNDDLDVLGMEAVTGDLGSNGSITDEKNGVPIDGRDGHDNNEYMDITPISWGIPNVDILTSDLTENSAFTFNDSVEEFGAVISFDSTKPSIEYMIEGLYDALGIDTYVTSTAVATIAEYDNIRLNLPSDTITFDTTNGDVILIINDDLQLKGDLAIVGNNKVIICVNNIGDVYTPNQYNIDDPDQLLFYLAPGAKFTFQTPAVMNARIIGPEATVYMSSGILNGSIIAGTFEGKGQSQVHYVESIYDHLITGFSRLEWK